jgi:hypothetical protein
LGLTRLVAASGAGGAWAKATPATQAKASDLMATMVGDLKIDDLGDLKGKVWSVNGLCKQLYVQSRSMRRHLQNTVGRMGISLR